MPGSDNDKARQFAMSHRSHVSLPSQDSVGQISCRHTLRITPVIEFVRRPLAAHVPTCFKHHPFRSHSFSTVRSASIDIAPLHAHLRCPAFAEKPARADDYVCTSARA